MRELGNEEMRELANE